MQHSIKFPISIYGIVPLILWVGMALVTKLAMSMDQMIQICVSYIGVQCVIGGVLIALNQYEGKRE